MDTPSDSTSQTTKVCAVATEEERQLLVIAAGLIVRLEPLIVAAERHPLLRRFLGVK